MKLDFLKEYEFFTGVPDSQLKPLCNYLIHNYGISKQHIIAANEGNAVALAAGYHLATSKIPVVYLQNSGLGNIINPVVSLMNDQVYGIPCIFIVGWRGEPGVHDEPQHIYQGKVTIKQLEDLDIQTFIIDKKTTETEVNLKMSEFKKLLELGKQVAFVVRKDALEFEEKIKYENHNTMIREEIIRHIVAVTEEDTIISTTGKTSRELFEIRVNNGQSHKHDFLTVGSMGHSSSIALGIALQKPTSKVWIIDGDGAALMHLGAMAIIGANQPQNLVHILINNNAHESVGGMPTVTEKTDFIAIAKGCGYSKVVQIDSFKSLDQALKDAKDSNTLNFIEIKATIGSRSDLGRPTTSPKENKLELMNCFKF